MPIENVHRKIISRKEARAILDAVEPDSVTKIQKRAMLEMLYRAGLRTCELVGLRTDEIEWPTEDNNETCWLHLNTTKCAKPRDVPVTDALYPWLLDWHDASERWKQEHGIETPYFFHPIAKRTQKPYSTRTIRSILAPIIEGAIGRSVNLHALRHTCATNLVESGVPVPGVQRMLGHQRISTTMIYVDVRGKALADAVRGVV